MRPTGVSPVALLLSTIWQARRLPATQPRRPCPNSYVPEGLGPIGVAVIFGVDELMDMGRTAVNLIGNCLATVVVARWEHEFNDRRATVFGTFKEIELDIKEGEVAFADAAKQGD